MKNYDETIDTVFRRMGEYEAAKKRRKILILRTATPLCCLLALAFVWIWKPASPAVTPPDTQAPTTALNGPFLVATDDPLPDNLDVVVINPIDSIPNTQRMNISLMWDDFIRMNQQELCAYYGTNVCPTVPGDLSRSDTVYGIFKRDNGTGETYWDCNSITFSNPDSSRFVSVDVDSGRIPFDFCNLFDEIKDRSTINGVQVGIGKTGYGTFYAEFLYNGAGFRVVADGLEKEELVDIIKSLTA